MCAVHSLCMLHSELTPTAAKNGVGNTVTMITTFLDVVLIMLSAEISAESYTTELLSVSSYHATLYV